MLNKFYIEEHVKNALKEDIGFEDITTDNLTSENDTMRCYLNTRQDGVFCGREVFEIVFKILSENIKVKFFVKDGEVIKKGQKLAEVSGSARAILTGERTALNYVQRMSGIATESRKYQEIINDYNVRMVDTRKTTPNFRIFEKYAVKTGCGYLHRYNLSDCAMIKDNHVKFAGSITKAIQKLKKTISHAHKIEVECDTLEQVQEALNCQADIIMLDNMTTEQMKEAVKIINHRAVVEASGNVDLERLKEIAATGVDIISSSAIAAKAPVLDLGLDA
ncbi:MAG: carboxylating nicotinate-nucleotide diphosphorylase [Candidatus Gastranaerophilales bacterium]|nr:carboxylating nicotinate-nucleotide diphosphorylase [Candidatus Gastranaerophilales bacterium]